MTYRENEGKMEFALSKDTWTSSCFPNYDSIIDTSKLPGSTFEVVKEYRK